MKHIGIFLHVIGEQIRRSSHEQDIPIHGGVQPAARERRHPLVDVQEGQVLTAAAAAAGVGNHPAGGGAQGLMGVVDENLKGKMNLRCLEMFQGVCLRIEY